MRLLRLSGPTGVGLFLAVFAVFGEQTLQEDFSADPAEHGWQGFGNTNLFRWNAADGTLAVTWDSRETNSDFARPPGPFWPRATASGWRSTSS